MNGGIALNRAEIDRVITRAGLRAAGLSASQIRRMVQDSSLRPLRTAVYAPASLVESMAGHEAGEQFLTVAAVLAVTGSHAAGSHRSAAAVHGLGLIRRRQASRVELTRIPGSPGSRSRRPGVLVHVATLPAGHVTMVRGVAFTSVARTVVDLARVLPFAEGTALADSALHDGRTTVRELAGIIAQCPRWPGIQRARRVVAFADPRSESVLESLGRAAFHEAGLPPPDLQVWVGEDGEIIGRADFLWRQYRTIAEADGASKYGNPQRALAQLERDARLRDAGYEVVHFTWPEITRVPGQVVAAVDAAFRRAPARRKAQG